MIKRIFNVFIILGFTLTFGFLKNVLLGRELSKSDFGLFNLIMTLVGFIYPLSLLGQHNALVRVLSKNNNGDYDWKRYISKLSPVMALVAGFLILGSTVFYDLSVSTIFFLTIAIFSSMIADLYTYILRAKGEYEISIILHRCLRFVLPLVLLVLLYSGSVKLDWVFGVFGPMYFLHAILVIVLTSRRTPAGTQMLTKQHFKEGLFMLGSDLSLLVIGAADKLFLGRLVSFEQVGNYFAVLSLMRLFDLALQAIDYVLMPHANKMTSINTKKIFLQILGGGLLISLFYLAFGGYLTHLIFAGKYDQNIGLIPYFCVIGILRLLYVLPSAIISGRLNAGALKNLVSLNSFIIVVNIVLTYWFISNWQITGALVATSITWFLRTSAAYTVFMRHNPDGSSIHTAS